MTQKAVRQETEFDRLVREAHNNFPDNATLDAYFEGKRSTDSVIKEVERLANELDTTHVVVIKYIQEGNADLLFTRAKMCRDTFEHAEKMRAALAE